MANIDDLQEVSGVFGGIKVEETTPETREINDNNTVSGVFGGAKFETEENLQQPTNSIAEVGGNLPTTPGIWDKVKSVLYYDFNFKLTPYQQKIEDELNDFIFEKLSWSNFKNFLFKNVSFGKNKNQD